MRRETKRGLMAAVLLVVTLCLFRLGRPPQDAGAPNERKSESERTTEPKRVDPAYPVLNLPPEAGGALEISHPLALAFGDGSVSAPAELEVLLELLQFFRGEFGSFPAGEDNPQIMNALRGGNPRQLPIFPRQHPRLATNGALLDAWGQPFVFHLLSSQDIEIRSSGPDGEIYTADDLVVPPPRE